MPAYATRAAAFQAKVTARGISYLQAKGNLAELYAEAVAVRPAARKAMEALNGLTTARLEPMGPLKRMSRASEKLVLEPDGEYSAVRILDIVRDMFVASTMDEVAALIDLIEASADIEVVRFKDRVAWPSSGWRDAMINYRVKGSTHVCEVQIVHNKMKISRTGLGGHSAYGDERNAREYLEYLKEAEMSEEPVAIEAKMSQVSVDEKSYEYVRLPDADEDDTDEQAAELGKGSFGTTYQMRHTIDKRLYAVKMISLKGFKRSGGNPERLHREARQLAQLDHPHIVRYFTSGEMRNAMGRVFAIFMELLSGGTLTKRMQTPPAPTRSSHNGLARSPRRSHAFTARACCTAISSPTTCSSTRTSAPRSSTSASRAHSTQSRRAAPATAAEQAPTCTCRRSAAPATATTPRRTTCGRSAVSSPPA